MFYLLIVSGSELQICPRGLTCCTEEMEKKLWIVSKDQYGKAIQASASSMQRLFNQRSNKFNGKNIIQIWLDSIKHFEFGLESFLFMY